MQASSKAMREGMAMPREVWNERLCGMDGG